MKIIRRLSIISAATIGLLISGAPLAHGPLDAERGLNELVRDSALIIHGRVVDLQYRNSEPNREEPNGVPHTFVTYEIVDTLRGQLGDGNRLRDRGNLRNPNLPATRGQLVTRDLARNSDLLTDRLQVRGPTLTLRFVGGADGRGGVYMETTTPTFARGQEDVLIIEGGELDDCPLVDCVEGRFRVIDERVYNAWGVPVVEAMERLRMGGRPRPDVLIMELPRPDFDALIQRPEVQEMMRRELANSSMAELRERYEREAPETQLVSYEVPDEPSEDVGGGQPSEPMEQFGPPLRLEEFLNAVRFHAERAGTPNGRVQSADPNTGFSVRPPRPAEFRAETGRLQLGDEEQREMESMQEGNDSAEGPVSPNLRVPVQPGGELAPDPTQGSTPVQPEIRQVPDATVVPDTRVVQPRILVQPPHNVEESEADSDDED